jgi:hypothetical protein
VNTLNKALLERRRHPRWRSEGARAYLYIRGGGAQRCKVRSVSKVGVFLEVDPGVDLARGLSIELAFTRSYTHEVIKLYRRSAYVTRVGEDGVAVVFLAKPRVLAQ